MRVLRKEFATLDNYTYYANALNRAIDTTYIPTASSIEEVVLNFAKIQLSRSFTCGFSNALLSLTFDEEALSIKYVSTSGTEVFIRFEFDDYMQFDWGYLEVYIPDDRAKPRRAHYERITKEFYEYTWQLGSQPPIEDGVDETALYPEWIYDKASNKTSIEDKNNILRDMGYKEIKVLGMLNAWEHEGETPVRYRYILEVSKNEYKLLQEHTDLLDRTYGATSWRRLLEILENQNQPKFTFDEFDDEAEYDEDGDYVDVSDDDEE